MCTLSVVASLDRSAVRLLMNRDERRLRPVAQPPAIRQTATGQAIWPTDPVGGGSWIAVNDAGVLLAVMNRDGRRTPSGAPSRGTVVPMLAGCRSLDEVAAGWDALDWTTFAPFRLVAITRRAVAIFEPGVPAPAALPLGRAQVWSSSSLGDHLVAAPRRALLEDLLRREADPWTAQTRFHQHAWPDRRHLSVMMSRVDACTVSCTEVILTDAVGAMTYRPIVDGWPTAATVRHVAIAARDDCAA